MITSLRSFGKWEPVGSRVTCDPPPAGSDEDWLVFVSDRRAFVDVATMIGYSQNGGSMGPPEDDGMFTSIRHGDENLIVTDDAEFAEKFLLATKIAKRLNLLRKADRVCLFQGVLYGRYQEGTT